MEITMTNGAGSSSTPQAARMSPNDATKKYKYYTHFRKVGGGQADLATLCGHFKISFQSEEQGIMHDKSEEDLVREVDHRLKVDSHMAWKATSQATSPDSSLVARTLLPATGISTSTISISLTPEDLLPIREGWGPSLCGMYAGRFPGKDVVITMARCWGVPTNIAFHSKGWILFCFKSYADLESIREHGPYSVFGIPLILEPTPSNFTLQDKVKLQVPIWIRIPDLPLTLWTKSAVEKIATTVGTPAAVDHGTIRRQTLDGPRVQVVLDVMNDPRDKVEIILPDGNVIQQKIVYEQLPKYCHVCHAFGHITLGCPGPEEREKIRLASRKRQPSRGRFPSRPRGASLGRDTEVRGSVNGSAENRERPGPAAGGSKAWEASGKNKSNGYKGPTLAKSQEVMITNQFGVLQGDEGADSIIPPLAETTQPSAQKDQPRHDGQRKRSTSRKRKEGVLQK